MPLSLTSLKQRNNVVLIVTIILGIIILLGLNRILGGLLGAIIIYVLFRPLNIYFQEKKQWNKSLGNKYYPDTFLLLFNCSDIFTGFLNYR
jgi:predicted membrane protein